MQKKKVAILYICTGRYLIFWEDFYKSSSIYFLNLDKYERHYFVFSDSEYIKFEEFPNIHKVYQEKLSWPYITLDRFKIFNKARRELEEMDYIYYFNANMLFVSNVGIEILPTKSKPLVMVKHPGFFNKQRSNFTYETNPKSLAYINNNEGMHYFMGGLNGGTRLHYLSLIDELQKRIDQDKDNQIMAVWHDESHLNRYAIDYSEYITILEPSYGYPQGWEINFQPKIIIRDKSKHGSYDFLRGK